MAVRLKYKPQLYTKQGVKDSGFWTTEEILDEANRLGRLKNRRIERVEKLYGKRATEDWDRAVDVTELVDERGQLDMSKVANEVVSSVKFLQRKTTTVTGYKRALKRFMRTANELLSEDKKHPKKVITEGNVIDFAGFLKDYRDLYNIQKIPDSDRVFDMYEEAVRVGWDSEDLIESIKSWDKEKKTTKEMLDTLKRMPSKSSSEDYEELSEY